MKKILYILFTICLSISFTNYVYADDFNLSLTGSDTIENTIMINLEVNSIAEGKEFYGLTAILNYDKDKLELSSIRGLNNFDLTHNSKTGKILLYSPYGTKENKDILSIKFYNKGLSIDEETSIYLSDIVVSDGHKDTDYGTIGKTIRSISSIKDVNNQKEENSESEGETKELSDNNYLSSITINNKKLDFHKETLNYDIIVAYDIDKIIIESTSESDKATIIGNGEYTLEVGSNEIEIIVTAEDGKERTYIVNINRENKESNQNEEDMFLTSNNNKDNKKSILNIIIPMISLIILLLIIIIFKRKGKKK